MAESKYNILKWRRFFTGLLPVGDLAISAVNFHQAIG
jgi:hypothetical protein